MSRHRNVRTMSYDDYDDDEDYHYGHSVEDDCISPTDAQQWMYDRAKGQQSMSAFLANHRDIEEEDDSVQAEPGQSPREKQTLYRRDSECYQIPELADEDRARLISCMEEIRNIIGEAVPDRQLVESIMKHNYDFNKALDDILNSSVTPPTLTPVSIVRKDNEDPVEKDYTITQMSQLSISQQAVTKSRPHFCVPKSLRTSEVPSSGNVNLSDLLKSRLKQETESSVKEGDSEQSDDDSVSLSLQPKLSELSINSDSGVASSSPAESTFSNLTDLARFHLQAQKSTLAGSSVGKQTGGFKIPNLFNKPAKTPVGLKNDLKQKSQVLTNQSDYVVDLKLALIKDKSKEIDTPRKIVRSSLEDKKDDESICYGFIDCDIVEVKPLIDEYCSIDSSAILHRQLANTTTICSGLARILCTRYRKVNLPRIRHGFIRKPTLVPFRFNIPSPDDIVLSHTTKFKR